MQEKVAVATVYLQQLQNKLFSFRIFFISSR